MGEILEAGALNSFLDMVLVHCSMTDFIFKF